SACGAYSVSMIRSLPAVPKAKSDGYNAIDGAASTRNSMPSRPACDARWARWATAVSENAQTPAIATATSDGTSGTAVVAVEARNTTSAAATTQTHAIRVSACRDTRDQTRIE